jgi:hypothetical protein
VEIFTQQQQRLLMVQQRQLHLQAAQCQRPLYCLQMATVAVTDQAVMIVAHQETGHISIRL